MSKSQAVISSSNAFLPKPNVLPASLGALDALAAAIILKSKSYSAFTILGSEGNLVIFLSAKL